MELSDYFARIGYSGTPRADLATLFDLHRAHLLAIPYENLDVQFGRPLTTDPAAAFDKIVHQGRGGWCYEMNGLFGWALKEIGFSVTRMAGAVGREAMGDGNIGNHLVLKIDLPDGPWIADVGFGDGPIDPYPLIAGPFVQRGFRFGLEDLGEGWWRLRNHPLGGAASFDVRTVAASEAELSERCGFLQTAEVSPFVQMVVVQRHVPDGVLMLRGRVLRTVRGGLSEERLISDAGAYAAMLKDDFALTDPEIPALWPKVVARHESFFGARAPA